MYRQLTFSCLLLSLGAIAVITLSYVDPPITDGLVFSFIKTNGYLPPGDTINRVELYAPVTKLLEADRRGYKTVLFFAGVALLSAVGLYFATSDPRKHHESETAPGSRPPSSGGE